MITEPAPVRVVDVTAGALPLVEALREAGAAIVRIDAPEGGAASSAGHPIEWPSPGQTIVRYLDLTCGPDRDDLLALVREVAVFVEAWKPGFAAMLGYGAEDLAAVNPALVYVSMGGEASGESADARAAAIMAAVQGETAPRLGSDHLHDPR